MHISTQYVTDRRPLVSRHLSPPRNISRYSYLDNNLAHLFTARIKLVIYVKRPCSSLGRLRRSNYVTLHYIMVAYLRSWAEFGSQIQSVLNTNE